MLGWSWFWWIPWTTDTRAVTGELLTVQDSSEVTTWAPVSFFMLRNLGGGVRPDLGLSSSVLSYLLSYLLSIVISTVKFIL